MNGERQLTAWLGRWAEASEQIERSPGETCLTADEIAAFVDDKLAAPERRRAGVHLSQCSYCSREVGSLLRAARDFEDRTRVNRALGQMTQRIGACVRVFVDGARGAFTRADGLLQGLAAPARLEPAFAPAGLGLAGLRSMDDGEE